MDEYLRFVNGVQALRRKTSALRNGFGGALGVAADPMPHQLAAVRRVLSDAHVRHLLSDEVGLGKTVQALMIMNALRWQDPSHRSLVIAPDNLLSQWQEECWIRGHVMPALAGSEGDNDDEKPPVTLARPRDLMIRPGEGIRTITADPFAFDLLVVDEPQTMPRETIQVLSQATDDFRQVLVLSATPRLGDPYWREAILRMIEPEASQTARLEGRTMDEVLAERELQAISGLQDADDKTQYARIFSRAAAGRRVIRNGRQNWGTYLPQRKNHEVRIQPLMSERLRHEIAARLLEGADPEHGLQGPRWTAAKALQRSARAARTVLSDVATQGGELGEFAEKARLASLEDPGDSQLSALIDILSEQWEGDPEQAFIVVCGDNPTIDMLRAALPRYFPDLVDAISVLRRPATTEVDGVTNLREIQETLAPLLSGENRLLLVGEWVQAGLNLHHVARGIIFFSLPWEIDSIDQLIGRIDRLGARGRRDGSTRIVNIWRILLEGSQEAAISDCVASLGIFDSPLPPLSPDELRQLQASLGRAAISRQAPTTIAALAEHGTGLPTRFSVTDLHTPEQAEEDFEAWLRQGCPEPAMMTDRAREADTPVRIEERALGAWIKTISRSEDFEIGSRADYVDEYRFRTMWYHRDAASGRAGDSPFTLPGANRDRWMSDHLPFIYRRSEISVPPRKAVFTDEGENTARPLHFLDHGSVLHDGIISGYTKATVDHFGPDAPVVQTSVVLPEGHPALGIGPVVLLTVAALDPFPDELVPPLWSDDAKGLLAAAPTDAQRKALHAERKTLQALVRAFQRRIRIEVPANMLRIGSTRGQNGWTDLSAEQTDLCLRPLTASTNNAVAKGRKPFAPLPGHKEARVVRSRHLEQIKTFSQHFSEQTMEHGRPALEALMMQAFGHFQADRKNRELALERRRQSPPDAGPVELWQGQVAALERSLAVGDLNNTEAMSFLQGFASGRLQFPKPKPRSILISLVAEA